MVSRIKPTNYNLSLFNLEFGGKWGYSGLVKIDAKVSEVAEEIVINTKELEIQSAEVLSGDGNCMCSPKPDEPLLFFLDMMLILMTP
jgi:hypothetical protein